MDKKKEKKQEVRDTEERRLSKLGSDEKMDGRGRKDVGRREQDRVGVRRRQTEEGVGHCSRSCRVLLF